MNNYKVRKAKHLPPTMAGKKSVRIDSRTTIIVSESISDDEARENYQLKREANIRKYDHQNNHSAQRWDF
jgi:hypothetical protein